MKKPEPRIVIHGGTSRVPAEDEPDKRRALEQGVAQAHRCLEAGGSAVEAVVLAVGWLEASGLFEAGRGATPQMDGVIRYDASLMSSDRRAGGIIGVSGLSSAIEGARRLHEGPIRHTTLAGESATAVLAALGMNVHKTAPRSRSVSDCVSQYLAGVPDMFGTVGAAALDRQGMLAAGSSTAGYVTALPGRTGDTGTIGAGTYASERCAVSCTGNGDRIVPSGLSVALDTYLECGLAIEEVTRRAMARLGCHGGEGGFVMLLPDGRIHVRANVEIIRVAASHPGADSESARWLGGL